MNSVRIMPCLDMKNGRVVKGIHFAGMRDAGDPAGNALFYQQEGADELAILDITATLENRKTRVEWVRSIASTIHIPITVGGGISELADIEMLLEAGAEHVSINSAAVKDPRLVAEAAKQYGSECITVAIDGKRNPSMPSGFEVVIRGGTQPIEKDTAEWAKQCEDLGASVLLPTSVDGDGTQSGYDLEFTRSIADAVKIPVVASGGAGKLQDFVDAVIKGHASVLLAASVFHFRTLRIREVKEHLRAHDIPVIM
ncbi:MAG TPA: imidazole glycerol phosphate synthase subunit HisF [Acidobacteriota bacterium]|nr:imidazole glycerol phosphate synthase subunit HisF [Acidobacteriota bacterium]